jgi:hypothetical protein
MTKKKQENKLWDKAKYSLEKHYDYICANPHSKQRKLREGFINIGMGGIIPDVIGIKNIGNQYEPKIEIITIEVKEDLPNYRERHMDQVRRASIFAHKVFLAAPREFEPKEVELAVREKVGLFELNPETKRLKLIVPSPPYNPSESKVVELMRRLEFFKCCICNCYWNKNLLNITGYRPSHVFSKNKEYKFVKFICEKCAEKLYDLHFKDMKKKFAEEWKMKKIKNQVDKVGAKAKKLAEKWEIIKIKSRLSKQEDNIKQTKKYLRETYNKSMNRLIRQFRRIRKGLKSV